MTTKIHLVAAGTHIGINFSLSPGNHNDSPEGRALLKQTLLPSRTRIIMDKGYSDSLVREVVRAKCCVPVVPPKKGIKKPWRYDKALYKQRNEVERLFHHLKNFRRIATRYDKLDSSYRAFVALGLVMLLVKFVNTT